MPRRRYVYQHEAVKELGRTKAFGVLSAGEWLRGKGHAVKSQFLAAKGAIDLMQVQRPSPWFRVPLFWGNAGTVPDCQMPCAVSFHNTWPEWCA